jgi:hypothetical protein
MINVGEFHTEKKKNRHLQLSVIELLKEVVVGGV